MEWINAVIFFAQIFMIILLYLIWKTLTQIRDNINEKQDHRKEPIDELHKQHESK